MNPSSLSPADSPAASSAYQDYLDELVPMSYDNVLDLVVDGAVDFGAVSPPSPPRGLRSFSHHLSLRHALRAATSRPSNALDLTGAATEGSPLENPSTSAGRPLETPEGPVGHSSSPLFELFSPATPPEGSSQHQQQAPADYSDNHLARFARIHSFMEARRRESESSAAAAAGSRGQSPARLSTASPVQSQAGLVPAEHDSVPPNVNPFTALRQGQPRQSVIRMSPPQSSGMVMPSIEPGQRQLSNASPRRDRGGAVVWDDSVGRDMAARQEGLQRRLAAMQEQREHQARHRSQVAIEEYLRNMRSSQRVQAFPPYQPPSQRQTIGGVTYVSQNPVYVSHLEYPPTPVTNSASPSPAQPSSEAGPSRSPSTRMNASSPSVSVLHTNPGQVFSIDQTLPMHRRIRQTIPSLGPQHTAYTPSAEVYADRAVAIASSPSTSGDPMEVEGSMYEVGVRLTHQASQQNQAQATQTDRMPRFRRHFHPEGPTSVLTEEETRLSAADRISRRRSERVASTPYDRLSAYTQTFTDRSSIPRAQPLHHVDTMSPFMAGIPDYGTLREPSSNTWRQERETRMQADMQQRINAEMHVRERVRAAVEARDFPRSTSHVTVAGERLSVDQQIPTRHMGVSRDLNPYYQQIRNDQESNAERRRRLYYIPQNPAGPPAVGVHYHRLPASLLHFMESGAIFMHHDGEPKLILEQDVISAIAVDTQSFKFDNQFAATEECIICFDEFALQQEVRVLSCNSTHRFHKECIDKWLIKNKPNCPICRRILPSLNQPKEPVVNMEQEAGPSHTHGHNIRPSSSTEPSEGFPLLPDFLADFV